MFGSFTLDSTTPRLRGKTKTTLQFGGNITLDFGEGIQKARRSSFLPESISKEGTDIKKRMKSSVSYLGASFFSPKQGKTSEKRTVKEFCTGSKYIGQLNGLGMAGKGIYKFPHGVIYDGYFNRKGEFHGSGMLIYPNGQRIEGFWRNGKLTKGASCVTAESSTYSDTYCRVPDRRFQIEVNNDLNPSGQEYLTNAPPPARTIPEGCYDAGDGFYEPLFKVILDYEDLQVKTTLSNWYFADMDRIRSYYMLLTSTNSDEDWLDTLRRSLTPNKRNIESIPEKQKEEWILNYCRKACDEYTGFRPDLYECWTTGLKADGKFLFEHEPQDFEYGTSPVQEKLPPDAHDYHKSKETSALFSFIQTKQKQKHKRDSLVALSSMFLSHIDDGNLTYEAKKNLVVKKNKILKIKSGKYLTRNNKNASSFKNRF